MRTSLSPRRASFACTISISFNFSFTNPTNDFQCFCVKFPSWSAERGPLHVIPSSTPWMASCCELTGAEKQSCVFVCPPLLSSFTSTSLSAAPAGILTLVRGGGHDSSPFVARRDTEPAVTAARFVSLATWIGSRLFLPVTLVFFRPSGILPLSIHHICRA